MIIIRTDANEYIGTGHVMRCLSIAKAFARHGEDVIFVTADDKGSSLIKQNGFVSLCLHTDYKDMESELGQVQEIVNAKSPKLLLVDGYYVTASYLHLLSNTVKTVYVDDLNVGCWDIDYLINYNIFAGVFDYSSYDGSRVKLILGPYYAPLRDEFRSLETHEIDDPTDILVSAGGADPEHITEKIMQEICPLFDNMTFHFVVGVLNPRLNTIKHKSEGTSNVVLHINEQNMSDLMKKCDIAISAAGSTLYELCASGVPCITYTLADNQVIAAEEFERQGLMLNAGDCRGDDNFSNKVKGKLEVLLQDKALRKDLSYKMRSLVDGCGADRIVEELLQ